ncbi:MAG: hypothetical protein LUH47_07945, partial [Clostridiales bacterium]|nr:hypothetical protein [Clostridiales bacterium]
IKIEDKGLLGAMLDEAEELLNKPLPEEKSAVKSSAEKTAKTINQITEKAAELIDEKSEEEPFSLDFSVDLPSRYYKTIESLAKQADELKKLLS